MRPANQAIAQEKHPVPTVAAALQEVFNSKVFSKPDLNMALYLIKLPPDSRDIKTFAAPTCVYRFKRVHFGVNTKTSEKNMPTNHLAINQMPPRRR